MAENLSSGNHDAYSFVAELVFSERPSHGKRTRRNHTHWSVPTTLSAPIPEDTTIMNFRHSLEKPQLDPAILAVINGYFQEKSLSLRQGTIVDATITHTHSSTKNKDGETHQL